MRYKRKIGWMILAGIAFAALFSAVTMALWNWLIPDLFGGPVITIWQAIGLLLLSKILFGFGKGGWKSGGRHSRHSMSPEEKAILREKFRERCGWKDEKKEDAES